MGDDRHQAYIVIHGPSHDGTTLPLREGITSFGRLPANDVPLHGDLVSRHHSRITFFEGRATLQDLGSHNGSWVNGDRVNSRVLKDGDVARVGNFEIRFHVGTVDPNRVKRPGYDETTAAEQSQSHSHSPPDPPTLRPQQSQSVLLQQLERAKTGAATGTDKALHLLFRASEAIARAVDTDGYLRDILALALEQIPSEVAAYLEAGETTRLLCAMGPNGPVTNPDISHSVVRWAMTKNFPVTTDDVANDLRFGGPPSVMGTLAAICVPIASDGRVIGAMYMARNDRPFLDSDLDALSAIGYVSAAGMQRPGDGGDAKQVLGRYFSPSIVHALTQSAKPRLTPTTATILCADIQGFGGLMERVGLEQVTEMLTSYLRQVDEIVHRNQGALIQTTGTRLLAAFGLDGGQNNAPSRAVQSALELRSAVDMLVKQRPSFSGKRLVCGLDTGWLLAGMVGTGDRMTYTIAGNTVQAAMKLESNGAPGTVLLADGTMQAVSQVFEAKKLGQTQLKGRSEPIKVYEVIGRRGRRR